MNDLEKIDIKQLKILRAEIDKELEKRQREEYDKLLKNFVNALEDLVCKFPNTCCFINTGETWDDLYSNYEWDF